MIICLHCSKGFKLLFHLRYHEAQMTFTSAAHDPITLPTLSGTEWTTYSTSTAATSTSTWPQTCKSSKSYGSSKLAYFYWILVGRYPCLASVPPTPSPPPAHTFIHFYFQLSVSPSIFLATLLSCYIRQRGLWRR